jgi:DNA (cytosine-5)-methyltransferase 1
VELLRGLDLFSGIGGISLALEPWVSPVAYCEIDHYCQGVLLSRMRDGHLTRAPIWDDVRTLQGTELPAVDIVYGGFPCQDISLAGSRKGLDGERSGLYREVIRLVDELGPTFVFLENVASIQRHAWRVVQDLAERGYDTRWTTLSAAETGAPHFRDRWWLLGHRASSNPVGILADPYGGRCEISGEPELSREQGQPGDLSFRCREIWDKFNPEATGDGRFYWSIEPDVGRLANGVPSHVDRLRALGNSVVPYQARAAFRYLMGLP